MDVPAEPTPAVTAPARARLLFVAAGTSCVLAGGLVAAAGGETPSRQLSWAAAYLVLVCGLAQAFLGAGQCLVAAEPPRPPVLAWQFVTFNLGNAGVLARALSGVLPALDAGSVGLLVALGLLAWATRSQGGKRRLLVVAYRVALVVLAVSVPVGGALAR